MSKLKKAKAIIKQCYECAPLGIFNTRSLVNDPMINIYMEDGLIIDICYSWGYFEVFGLSNEEFEKLEEFYKELGRTDE